MRQTCKWCELDFNNEDPEWLEYNEKSSEYCSQDCEREEQYHEHMSIVYYEKPVSRQDENITENRQYKMF